MYIPCTKAVCLIWTWRLDSPPLHFAAWHPDVNPEQVLSCFGSQGREGHFQGGIHLSHCSIASLGYNVITPLSPHLQLKLSVLNRWFLSQLLFLTPTSWLQTPTTVCHSKFHHLWWLNLDIFLRQWQSLNLALLQAWSSKELKPGSQLQNLTPTDCYSITIDAIQKSRVTAMIIFHVHLKKKKIVSVLEFSGVTFWPKIGYINSSDICNHGQGF